MSPNLKHSLFAALALALAAGVPAHAQTLPYGSASDDGAEEGDGDSGSGRAARPGKKIEFTHYIEAGQVVVHRPGSTKEVRSGVETENGQPFTVGSGATTATVNISMLAGEIVITEES